MATTRTLVGSGEVIEDSELTVINPLNDFAKVYLPEIGPGATEVQDQWVCTISCTGEGQLEVLDIHGQRVAIMHHGEIKAFCAHGDAEDHMWMASGEITEMLSAPSLATNGTLVPELTGGLLASTVLNLTAIAAGVTQFNNVTVTGAVLGDFVMVSTSIDPEELQISGEVDGPNNVRMSYTNHSLSSIDLAECTFYIKVMPRVGILPAGAATAVSGWIRMVKPDGTIGLVPFWNEIA